MIKYSGKRFLRGVLAPVIAVTRPKNLKLKASLDDRRIPPLGTPSPDPVPHDSAFHVLIDFIFPD